MRAVILIPWRSNHGDRDDIFERTWHHQWEPLNLPVYTGDSGSPKFNRGASRNTASRRADAAGFGRWDVALFADADVLLERANIRRALDDALRHNVIAFPHDRYHALGKDGRLLQQSTAPTNGGALAISRTAWDLVQGYDERFAGWGYEDAAFRLATETLLGDPIRIPGPMKELHHAKTGRARSDDERRLYERYKSARGDWMTMKALVDEDPVE